MDACAIHAGIQVLLKLQKNRLFLIFLLAASPSFLFAQDIIIKNDKSELKAKVVEITSDFIKYHDWDNLSGPIYNIAKSQVFMINYQNSKREFIALVGGSYYLNEALKLDKTKGALYIGAAVAYTYTAVTSDASDEMVSSGDFGGFGRVGGRLNFTKGFGAFAEVHVGQGDPAIIAGLTFSIIK